ncbi:MAG TPA: alpha/beta fold hydrolase [Oligoflexus sp.]|uniref:alpha/beta hydrolase family esterase n=1 Tax=Oligoflexus sp. TaxID=1971216 RepID=UPI002D722660|nr:alpha/beta fold hydrolase [Oligoflexus sp.]HYX36662.1 alpha/beta fold hydrolase [Oligoflexus sp.]
MIEEAKSRFAVDPERIYIIGHSNGGFIAYTMACIRPDLIRGVVSIAGTTYVTAEECKNPAPTNILHIHGDLDPTVGYESLNRSPGALTTVGRWATINGCQTRTDQADALDLVRVKWEVGVDQHGKPALDGKFLDFVSLDFKKETDTSIWSDCTGDSRVELWKVKGSKHVPSFWGTGVIEQALNFVR